MPYFVFRRHSTYQLECLGVHDDYRTAKTEVRRLRQAHAGDDPALFRLVHASTELEGERLLLERREAPPLGEDG